MGSGLRILDREQKQHIHAHLEAHKGQDGLYVKDRQTAYQDCIEKWKEANGSSTGLDSRAISGEIAFLSKKLHLKTADLLLKGVPACGQCTSRGESCDRCFPCSNCQRRHVVCLIAGQSRRALGVDSMISRLMRPPWLRTHGGIYNCAGYGNCKKRCRKSQDLANHIRNIHDIEHPYICGVCDRGWNDIDDCKQHIFDEHKGSLKGGFPKDVEPPANSYNASQPEHSSSVTPAESRLSELSHGADLQWRISNPESLSHYASRARAQGSVNLEEHCRDHDEDVPPYSVPTVAEENTRAATLKASEVTDKPMYLHPPSFSPISSVIRVRDEADPSPSNSLPPMSPCTSVVDLTRGLPAQDSSTIGFSARRQLRSELRTALGANSAGARRIATSLTDTETDIIRQIRRLHAENAQVTSLTHEVIIDYMQNLDDLMSTAVTTFDAKDCVLIQTRMLTSTHDALALSQVVFNQNQRVQIVEVASGLLKRRTLSTQSVLKAFIGASLAQWVFRIDPRRGWGVRSFTAGRNANNHRLDWMYSCIEECIPDLHKALEARCYREYLDHELRPSLGQRAEELCDRIHDVLLHITTDSLVEREDIGSFMQRNEEFRSQLADVFRTAIELKLGLEHGPVGYTFETPAYPAPFDANDMALTSSHAAVSSGVVGLCLRPGISSRLPLRYGQISTQYRTVAPALVALV